MQATEPYNNEESASRDEGGNALAEISADDNIYDIVNISNDDNVSDDDNFEEALAGEMVPVKSTDEKKIHEIQSTVVNSNNKTEAGSKVEGVNSKKAMASNSLSQTISTTDSLVEIESLRTQVSVFYSPALWFFKLCVPIQKWYSGCGCGRFWRRPSPPPLRRCPGKSNSRRQIQTVSFKSKL